MGRTKPRALMHLEYEKAAQAYLKSLPLEHFMEETAQATQREITLASLALVRARRPEVQVFNELLVQYPHGRPPRIRQVVPDNMVVVHPEPLRPMTSFNLPLQPVGPFWMLEYVSRSSERKDYEDNFQRYERELKVPYYLIFYPEPQELTLYRHTGRKYRSVKPNEHDRFAIEELELEVGVLGGWARFWFRGELLGLPGDLQRQLDEKDELLAEQSKLLQREQERANRLEDEIARLRAQLALPPVSPP
jgi:Uma2 family endonuclease